MVADDAQTIDRLAMLSEGEREQVLYGWNETKAEFSSEKCVHELFEEQVRRSPQATAVVFEKEELSYGELNVRANRLAHYLRELGVKPDERVAICVERGFEMIVGLLAILKAGGGYVPLDPAYPEERLQYMLEDSNPVVLLTQKHLRNLFSGSNESVEMLDIGSFPAAWQRQVETNLDVASDLTSRNLAYVLYAFGSTGVQKGVMVEHRGVVNFLCSMAAAPGITAQDRLLAVTSISFDIAALELYLPWSHGAQMVVAGRRDSIDPHELQQLIKEHGATIMQATPATWRALLNAQWKPPAGLKILCGGEALPADLAVRLAEQGESLWNLYGPTETTIWSACVEIERDAADATVHASIGRPIANTQIYLLDEYGEPVPVGAVGEIYIGGAGVARGYLNRPDLTAERFVGDPFGGTEGRMYKTGDVARYLADGNIEFLGRNDRQVKIRGFRIELGEIEARLAEHPAVGEAVWSGGEDTAGEKRLVAYYTTSLNDGLEKNTPSAEQLRAYLSARLLEDIVPAAFMESVGWPL